MNKIELKYNTPYQVNKKDYTLLSQIGEGILAHREQDGKYYVKLMSPNFKAHIQKVIIKHHIALTEVSE